MGMEGNGNSPHGNPMGISQKWEWGWEGMGMLKAIPAHLYCEAEDI